MLIKNETRNGAEHPICIVGPVAIIHIVLCTVYNTAWIMLMLLICYHVSRMRGSVSASLPCDVEPHICWVAGNELVPWHVAIIPL